MGFFKKIFKGVKKVFKKIGKGIKSAFKSIGKFMGKIGIIGQIGLALVLPGVGQILSGMLVGTTPGVVGGLAGSLQGMGAVGQAASSFIQGAVKVASNTGKFFSSITDGVTQVVGDTIGAAAKNLGITVDSTLGQGLSKLGVNMDVDGWGGVFTNAQKSFGNITEAGKSIFDISQPVGDPTATALAQDQMGNITEVSEGLQGQIDSATAFDVTSPIGETVVRAPNLSPDPFGPVGEIGGITYEMGPPSSSLLSRDLNMGFQNMQAVAKAPVSGSAGNIAEALAENIAQQGGSGTAADPFFASGKAAVAPDKSFLEKASEFVTGRDVAGNIAEARAGVGDLIAGAPRTVAEGVLSKGMQAIGLEDVPEYQYNQYAIAVPALDMGSTTSIGQELNTGQPEQFFNAYRGQMASNAYGATANFFNIYPEYMQRALG